MMTLAKNIAEYNRPPFAAQINSHTLTLTSSSELLEHTVNEAKKGFDLKRFKGLGEMNHEQLWETTMNPENRTLLQVRLEDATECELVFTTLMGEDVELRRKFIEENALDVKNLDI